MLGNGQVEDENLPQHQETDVPVHSFTGICDSYRITPCTCQRTYVTHTESLYTTCQGREPMEDVPSILLAVAKRGKNNRVRSPQT